MRERRTGQHNGSCVVACEKHHTHSSTGDDKVARDDARAASSSARKGGNRTLRRAKKGQSSTEIEKGTTRNSGNLRKCRRGANAGDKETEGVEVSPREERECEVLGFWGFTGFLEVWVLVFFGFSRQPKGGGIWVRFVSPNEPTR